MPVALGKIVKKALELQSATVSPWETGAAAAAGVNSGYLVNDWPLLDERPIRTTVSLGQARASSWVQQAIKMGGQFNKVFRFGGKDHQFIGAAMGTVGTLSYRALTKLNESTATGGSATTFEASGGGFGSSNELVGRFMIVLTGTAIHRIEPIISHTDIELTFASGTAIVSGDTCEVVVFAPAIFDICDGTATTTTVKNTTNLAMTVNEHAGSWLTFTAGTNVGITVGVLSNTADTFTFKTTLAAAPDGTSVYDVMDTACTHIYEINDDGNEGIYFTDCTYIGPYIKEVPHLKIGAFQISGTYDEDIMLQVTAIGDQEVTDSVINTDQTLWTIREQENEVPVVKSTVELLMNRASTGALSAAGADNRKINDFLLNFEQPLEGVLRTGPGSDNIVSEPLQNDHPKGLLNFTEPLTETVLLKDERNGNYPQKAGLTITGAALNAFQNREMVVLMPKVALNEVNDAISDAGFVETTVACETFDASSAPTGITYTDMFKIEITDDYGGNPIQLGNT